MDSTETTPRRRIPRAVVVSAMALGVAAGGYGIANAASGDSTAPAVTQQSTGGTGSSDEFSIQENSAAPNGYGQAPNANGGNGERTAPNGEPCDQSGGERSGDPSGSGSSSSSGTSAAPTDDGGSSTSSRYTEL